MRKLLLPLLLLICTWAAAQQKFAFDSVSKHVCCKQSFKLNPKVKSEDVYAVAQRWFSDNPSKFVQMNAEPPIDAEKAKKNKNKIEVDREFGNIRPLQSLDPAGGKIVGLGLLKYYGGSSTAIRLLYLKYDIYLEVVDNLLSVKVSNLRYFHFNPSTYAKMGVYSFNGGQPCEPMGTMEELISCENAHTEFGNMAGYFNNEVGKLFTDLKGSLKSEKVLYDPTASAKPVDKKPAAKKPAPKPAPKPVAKKQ